MTLKYCFRAKHELVVGGRRMGDRGVGRRPRNKVYLMFADHVATKATFFLHRGRPACV
jgi:hypothetical protein